MKPGFPKSVHKVSMIKPNSFHKAPKKATSFNLQRFMKDVYYRRMYDLSFLGTGTLDAKTRHEATKRNNSVNNSGLCYICHSFWCKKCTEKATLVHPFGNFLQQDITSMRYLVLLVVLLTGGNLMARESHASSLEITVADKIAAKMNPEGRLFFFLSQRESSPPYTQIWPNGSNQIFAMNLEGWTPEQKRQFDHQDAWIYTGDFDLSAVPANTYYVQVLWDQDQEGSRINAPGNLISTVQKIDLNQSMALALEFNDLTPELTLAEHPLLKEVHFRSEKLSRFWNKDVYLKAAVLLPAGFEENPEQGYPVLYNIAGYGGRYTRVNRYVQSDKFLQWWEAEGTPQIINVFLDGEGPYGDCYQLDSDNNGPYGAALTEELIPYLERTYRGQGTPESRYLDGCSTGGWVSLALQIFYPDFFNGAYSFSPDAVDFSHFQLINLYEDPNAFVNESGYLRPLARDITGEPSISFKDFIQYENVLGRTNNYATSGGQFSAFNALYGPKGKDGLPSLIFDPQTGEIDQSLLEHWKQYDLRLRVEENWETLGPKLQGKLWVWMGDMDNFYLNPAMRSFDEMLKKQQNPVSDAEINFSPMQGHCWQFDHVGVMKMIAEKMK
jgi:enterochelin esterase-like enzyme